MLNQYHNTKSDKYMESCVILVLVYSKLKPDGDPFISSPGSLDKLLFVQLYDIFPVDFLLYKGFINPSLK